jgi:multidrug efflux pump subunit AcrA (membrane-fusion protein)
MSDVQTRINSTLSRADQVLAEQLRREIARQQREDAEQARADAAQSRADSERCRQAQVKYDEAYRDFGVQTPPPIDGERPGRYRMRLYEGLRRKLPSDHGLFGVRADDIPGGDAARNFEQMMLEAAKLEAAKPSVENLPASGELVRRDVTDPMTGAKEIRWMGRESFIKEMSRGGQKVLRIVNPKTGAILMGEPMPKAW